MSDGFLMHTPIHSLSLPSARKEKENKAQAKP